MKAIILAAGVGSRLHPLTKSIPKTLVKVNGKPMLQYLVDNLLENGIEKIGICTGFEHKKIKDFCKKNYPHINFNFIQNNDFSTTNNMYSLYLAENFLDEELFLMNADLVFDCQVITKMIKEKGTCVAVDKGKYNEESMKITVENGYISSISKKTSKNDSYGCSIDVYKISKNDTKKIRQEMKVIIEKNKDLNQWTELMLDNLFKSKEIKAKPVDINGYNWYEIDNFKDLEKAEEIFNKETLDEIKNKKVFFIDGDGTLYIENSPIIKNLEYVKKLIKSNKKVFFMTNNTSKTPSEYSKSLKKKGIYLDKSQILTPLFPTIAFLRKNQIKEIYLIANKKISRFFKRYGFTLNSKNPQAVILTYDTEINFKKLKEASVLLNNKLPYYATHPDLFCPTSNGPAPDIGCFIETFKITTGRIPDKIFGKPSLEFLSPILDKYKLKEKDAVIIGDRLKTDIKMADNSDVTSILVLTGESDRALIQESDIKPDIILRDLSHLPAGN